MARGRVILIVLSEEVDVQEYKIVGKTFRFGRKLSSSDYAGPIVASRQAFFLIIDLTPKQALSLQFGGVVGLLAAKALDALSTPQHEILECDYSELPDAVTSHPDWPVRRKKGRVVVIPRDAIDHIEYAYWGTYDLICGENIYCLGLNFIGRSSAMTFLEQAGWNSKVDSAKHLPLTMQLIVPLGLFAGLIVGGIVGRLCGAPWSGRHSVIDYAVPGAILGLIVTGIISFRRSRKE
jgi:hypothetical protein